MIINVSELSPLILDEKEIMTTFFSGLWQGIKMCFDSPLKIMLWLVILGLIILGKVLDASIRKKRIRQMARIQAEEMAQVELRTRAIVQEELKSREQNRYMRK